MNRLAVILLTIFLFLSGCSAASTPAVPPASLTAPLPRENAAPAAAIPVMKSPVVQEHVANDRWIAIIQLDGNVHLLNTATGWWKQVTEDGNGSPQAGTSPAQQATYYCCMSWSSDGKLLAFRGTTVIQSANGTQYHFSIVVYDADHETVRTLLQNAMPSGLAFRPGTHLLAYDEVIDAAYFSGGQPDPSKARGIMGLNIDTGEISELVKPERGFWLSAPRWSPDGSVLGFLEQKQFEVPGSFALYDFQKQAYHPWDQAIGTYSFAPDGRHIAFDRLVSGMTGESSRIWISDLLGQGEQALSPEGIGVAHAPIWSPLGDQIAYLVNNPAAGPDAQYKLIVQPASGGEPRHLGAFASAGPLAWSADGARLAFSADQPGEPHFFSVILTGGAVTDLGIGYDPAWQP